MSVATTRRDREKCSGDELNGEFGRHAAIADPFLDEFFPDGSPDTLAQFVVDRIAGACKQCVVKPSECMGVLQHGQAELEQAATCFLTCRLAPAAYRPQMRLDARAAQSILVGIVGIEGRPANICPLANVLDRDGHISLLRDQGYERVLQQAARPRDASRLS
ncbi:hypothetical protein X757_06585 [Mesorhizobium sp. LSHC414A00]|nr:hypothetical protein [Mesorhizobium sp. LSHC414A00]ESX78361.1 hypothetical protein X757_06585 [Mesorhizobium sp. LSHC414A00]